MQKILRISTHKRIQFYDITKEVEEFVAESGIKEGLCNIYVPHATAAVTINENADPEIEYDINDLLSKLVPPGVHRHDKIDNNGDAHIKASIVGSSETIPIKNGKLMLGTWQDVFITDFDGPRDRKVVLTLTKIT